MILGASLVKRREVSNEETRQEKPDEGVVRKMMTG